ncbi:hypothetical protein ETD86_23965 [Nonomuraea turkmeniaca]|uniref:Uncharacterized protein n=1 Tax=Nonomuraea turkmeniaca TaxID=103838 RepID=A0A5S4FEG9_9ACTN|nr:hypothetical protein [Nonomuraea turkmeniaca]TMR16984.1 hypothetical protein ETD86_23965 [Nonomuraea turkmeniaca]
MMYGPPEYPPPYPRATSSPTIILLVSGLAALLGFLLGVFVGFGAGTVPEGATPTITITAKDTAPPADQPTTGPTENAPPSSAPQQSAPTQPGATQPGATQPGATQPGATQPGATQNAPPGGGTTAPAINPASLRTLVVGRDIQAGTYRTAGPTTGFSMCFWARMKSTSANPADVITSDMPTGPATVTIEPTDKAFQTGGCAEWARA